MTNTINTASSGSESVAQHLDIINNLCDAILDTFTPSWEQITEYTDNVTTSLSTQDHLLADTTLRKIKQLDRHLDELHNMVTEENLMSHHRQLWSIIQEKTDTITQALASDNYFRTNYERRMTQMIHKLQTMKTNRLITA